MNRPIFLIGYMGCGKTTLGAALAQVLQRRFLDLDHCLEQRHGQSVSELFARLGEARFRRLEHEALRQVAAMTDVVVSCGGGTPCHDDNIRLMNHTGITVWLTTGEERLTKRLLRPEEQAKRPLLADKRPDEMARDVHQRLTARTPYYSQAQLTFDSTDIEDGPSTIRTARRLAQVLQAIGR